jgi:hypothetical protein
MDTGAPCARTGGDNDDDDDDDDGASANAGGGGGANQDGDGRALNDQELGDDGEGGERVVESDGSAGNVNGCRATTCARESLD